MASRSPAPAVQAAEEDRFDRLLEIAEKYEQKGKTEVAQKLYEQILEEDPTHSVARNRITLLNESLAKAENYPQPLDLKKTETAIAKSDASNVIVPVENEGWVETLDSETQQPKSEDPQLTRAQQQEFLALLEEHLEHTPSPAASTAAAATETLDSSQQKPSPQSEQSFPEFVNVAANTESAEPQVAETPEPAQVESLPSEPIASIGEFDWAPTNTQGDAIASQTTEPSNSSETPWWDAIFEEGETAPKATSTPAEETTPKASPGKVTLASTLVESSSETETELEVKTAVEVRPAPVLEHPTSESTRLIVESDLNPTVIQPKWAPTRPEETPVASPEEIPAAELAATPIPENLQPVIALLSSEVPGERISGLVQLSLQGPEAQPASLEVRKLLEDPNPLVRTHAAGTIRDLEGDAWDTVHELRDLLTEDDPQVVQLSAYLLGKMGPEAMDAVEQLCQIRDQGTGLARLHAAEALLNIVPHDPRSYAVLEQALASVPVEERYFAAVTLAGMTGDYREDAAIALRVALHDEEAIVRSAAALSLGALQEYAMFALPDLMHMAEYDLPEVRISATTALDCLSTPSK
ncbi:HEAT repeat domain-containing protein [Thalassoglobus neptunius]|nr:HEAT repeat domain-containing protein [Thalassoglobus neptunius]